MNRRTVLVVCVTLVIGVVVTGLANGLGNANEHTALSWGYWAYSDAYCGSPTPPRRIVWRTHQ